MRGNSDSVNRRQKYAVAVILSAAIFCCLFLFPGTVHAQEKDSRETVRVGTVTEEGYSVKDQDGVERGYDVEYAIKVAQYAGLKLQFVNEPDYKVMLDDLADGKIDMALGVAKTKERAKRFIFAETESGTGMMSVCVRSDDGRFDYGNVAQLKGKKFCAIKDSAMVSAFTEWCAGYDFVPDITEYSTAEKMDEALQSGKMDAEIIGGTQINGYRMILDFSATKYYFAFQKDRTDLKGKVDEAMFRIIDEDHSYALDLHNKYLGSEEQGGSIFTAEEQAYIKAHNAEIKVAVLDNDPPFYQKKKDGTITGIIPEYYGALSEYSGLKFSFVPFADCNAEIAALSAKNIDVIGFINDDVFYAEKNNMLLTRYYTRQSMVKVTRTGSGTLHEDAVRQSDTSAVSYFLNRHAKGVSVSSYATMSDCYRALKDRKADAIICGIPDSTWFMNQHRASEYTVTNIPGLQWSICGAVRMDDSLLASVLSKAAAASESRMDGILANSFVLDGSIYALLNKIPVVWVMLIMAVLTLIIVTLVLLAYKNLKQKEKIKMIRVEARAQAAENARAAEATFLSNMSHDMRTPLNGIMGFTNLAIQTQDYDSQREYLKKIDESSRLMLDIINDVLDISKIESGKVHLEYSVFRLKEQYGAILENIRQSAMAKNIELKEKDDSGFDYIYSDRIRLQQVFLNLLSNAVKYTKPGGHVKFLLSRTAGKDGGYGLRIIVKDDGIGIKEDFLAHIFDPFTQEGRYKSSSVQGTGLGLAIVKKIIDLMNGQITVQSRENAGTTFDLYIPVREAEPEEIPQNETVTERRENLTGKHVLLCEDNDINAEITETMLMQKGIAVDRTKDGQDGTEKFSNMPQGYYDIILMDIRMPNMDGYEAATVIRSMEREDAKTVPIIALTADAFFDDITRAKTVGMNGHIAKPIDFNELLSTMEQMLNRKSND